MNINSKMSRLLAGLFKNPINVGITDYFFLMMLFGVPMGDISDGRYAIAMLIMLAVFEFIDHCLEGRCRGLWRSRQSVALLFFYLFIVVLSFFAWAHFFGSSVWFWQLVIFYGVVMSYAWFKFCKFANTLKNEESKGE